MQKCDFISVENCTKRIKNDENEMNKSEKNLKIH